MSNPALSLAAFRFMGDRRRHDALRTDESLCAALDSMGRLSRSHAARRQLLAHAVRVDVRYLPDLAASFERISEIAGIDEPFEAYVHAEPSINACVMRGRSRYLVVVSSGAVNDLDAKELEFVIGHEVGHALHGHLDIAAGPLIQSGDLTPSQIMLLLAWSRAAEISADRAGLLCCQSIDVAANAMFKTLSGLGRVPIQIDPIDFAEQWDHLADEVVQDGDTDHWQLSHPFPPLRMRALNLFWDAWQSGDADTASFERIDERIAELLALMDPAARERSDGRQDPYLRKFLLWGGLYVASADGHIDRREVDRLKTLVGKDAVADVARDGKIRASRCLDAFDEAVKRRRRKISALEARRILEALVGIALSDGSIHEREREALVTLGGRLGVPAAGVRLLEEEILAAGA